MRFLIKANKNNVCIYYFSRQYQSFRKAARHALHKLEDLEKELDDCRIAGFGCYDPFTTTADRDVVYMAGTPEEFWQGQFGMSPKITYTETSNENQNNQTKP